jgi:hypothetical protein
LCLVNRYLAQISNEWKTQKKHTQIQINILGFLEEPKVLITSTLEFRILQAFDFCYTERAQYRVKTNQGGTVTEQKQVPFAP